MGVGQQHRQQDQQQEAVPGEAAGVPHAGEEEAGVAAAAAAAAVETLSQAEVQQHPHGTVILSQVHWAVHSGLQCPFTK